LQRRFLDPEGGFRRIRQKTLPNKIAKSKLMLCGRVSAVGFLNE